jgi:hypothetical protein
MQVYDLMWVFWNLRTQIAPPCMLRYNIRSNMFNPHQRAGDRNTRNKKIWKIGSFTRAWTCWKGSSPGAVSLALDAVVGELIWIVGFKSNNLKLIFNWRRTHRIQTSTQLHMPVHLPHARNLLALVESFAALPTNASANITTILLFQQVQIATQKSR